MDENPRIAELRKKLEKDPGSRLFAQLAEELRKEGRFEDAISVSRKGLEKNPNYPSARLTYARAILDSGRPGEARPELEQIVKASPDNILAGRLLGDALEDVGDIAGAISQLERTVRLSPGDKALTEKIGDLKKKLAAPPAVAPSPVAVSAVLPSVFEGPAAAPVAPAALPSVFADEEPAQANEETLAFTQPPTPPVAATTAAALDRDLASGTLTPGSMTVGEIMHFEPAAELPGELPTALPPIEEPIVEQTLAFTTVAAAVSESAPLVLSPSVSASEPEAETIPPEMMPSAPRPEPALEADDLDEGAQTLPLTSMTLADLYLQQGLKAEASAVLAQVLKEEPDNARAQSKLAEVSEQTARAAATAAAEPVEHFAEEGLQAPVTWPTAPIRSLPASAIPQSMLETHALAPPSPSAVAPASRTRQQTRDESILALKAFLSATEREALQQRATEQRSF